MNNENTPENQDFSSPHAPFYEQGYLASLRGNEKLPPQKSKSFNFAVLSATNKQCKEFSLVDGILKKGSLVNPYAGNITALSGNIQQFAELLSNLSPSQSLLLGTPHRAGQPMPSLSCDSLARLAKDELDKNCRIFLTTTKNEEPDITKRDTAIAKSLQNIRFVNGKAGFLVFDFDGQDLSLEEIKQRLFNAIPELIGVACVITASSSSFIYDSAGNKLTGGKGWHFFFAVQNMADLPRVAEIFWQRQWLCGYGFYSLSQALIPTALEYGLWDRSVTGKPERLLFEAKPILNDGLTQKSPAIFVQDGVTLDTSKIVELSAVDLKQVQRLQNEAKAKVKPEIERLTNKAKTEHLKKRKLAGVSKETALAEFNQLKNRILTPDFALITANGDIHAGALNKSHDGLTMADPFEPDYDGGSLTKAKFYWNNGKNPIIFSQAHSGIKYQIQIPTDSTEAPPHYPHKKYLSAQQASQRLQTLSDTFFENIGSENQANIAIKASAGSGKTRAVINSLSKQQAINSLAKINVDGQIHVFVPTHELADEWQSNLKNTAPHLKVLHLFGRSGIGAENRFCNRYQQVQEVLDKKIPVYPTMCEQSPREGTSICPFYRECRYITQFNQGDDIVIMPHSYLSFNHSKLEEKPAAVVIDERFFTELISSHSYQINKINDLEALKDFRFNLLSAISKVKEKKIGLFSALREATQLNTEELIQLLNEILEELGKIHNPRSTHGLKPTSSELFFKDCLSKIKTVSTEVTIISVILKELEKFPDREESSLFRIRGDYYTINNRHTDNRFNYYLDNNIPILMIDADGNKLILDTLLSSKADNFSNPPLPFVFHEIAVKRTAKVIQYTNSQFAKSRFFPRGEQEPDTKRVSSAAQLIEKISNNKKTLVITYKALEPILKNLLPDNISVLHFGGIRGIDAFKHYDKVIILGRNQPPAHDMENTAAALFWADAQQIEFLGGYEKQERQYRAIKGSIKANTHVHKDSRVQAILEQFRECETLQAIDRLRFIHSTDAEREIHILTDTVLDIDVDVVADSKDVLPKGRQALAEIMLVNGGILPLSPTFLFSCYPDKFNNIQQVKDDLQRWKSVYSNLYIQQSNSVTYKLSGQKGGKNLTALFQAHLNPVDVINRLQELHGKAIQVISFKPPEHSSIAENIEQIEVKPVFERIEGVKFTLEEQRLEQTKMPVVLPYRLITGESGTVIGYDGIEQCRANLYERYGERLAA